MTDSASGWQLWDETQWIDAVRLPNPDRITRFVNYEDKVVFFDGPDPDKLPSRMTFERALEWRPE